MKSEEAESSGRGSGLKTAAVPVNWLTDRWGRLRQFFHEVRVELQKVTWPSRADVRATTLVVIVTIGVFALYFLVVDSAVGYLMQQVFNFFTKAK